MDIYVDTADLMEIETAKSWGILDGVTTNPTLIKRAAEKRKEEGINLESYLEEVCSTAGTGKPVSLEVVSKDANGMVEEAKKLYERFNPVADNVVIKIPVNTYASVDGDKSNYEGLKALKQLDEEGIPTNATLVMSPEQALLAAKAGASYVSPFAGRIDDYVRNNLGISFEKGEYFNDKFLEDISSSIMDRYFKGKEKAISDFYSEEKLKDLHRGIKDNGIASGTDLIQRITKIFDKYDAETKIIAASIRNTRHVRKSAEAGCDIATIPFSVISEMLEHVKTKEGVEKFSDDAESANYEKLF